MKLSQKSKSSSLPPYEGSFGEALDEMKELTRRLYSGEISQSKFNDLSQPYVERIQKKIKDVAKHYSL